jgi:hypothetical protein
MVVETISVTSARSDAEDRFPAMEVAEEKPEMGTISEEAVAEASAEAAD